MMEELAQSRLLLLGGGLRRQLASSAFDRRRGKKKGGMNGTLDIERKLNRGRLSLILLRCH